LREYNNNTTKTYRDAYIAKGYPDIRKNNLIPLDKPNIIESDDIYILEILHSNLKRVKVQGYNEYRYNAIRK